MSVIILDFQGVAHERGAFFSYQLPNRHPSEKICSQYSDFSAPLTPVGRRKKSDEEDFRVPIFNHSLQSQECGKYGNDPVQENVSPSNPSGVIRPLKFHKFKRTDMLESNARQEGKSQTEKKSKEFASDRAKAISNSSSIEKQIDSSVCREPRDSPDNSVDRLQTSGTIEPELRTTSVLAKGSAALDERNSAAPLRSHKRSFRSVPLRNLERADSVSEISVVESITGLDMTPDDVVGIIGQKHFWKARKAILK